MCPISVPHLSLPLSPVPLALPDWLPRRLPPLEGGAWLHPRVAELYAPSGEERWECEPAAPAEKRRHGCHESLHFRLRQLVSGSAERYGEEGVPQEHRGLGGQEAGSG